MRASGDGAEAAVPPARYGADEAALLLGAVREDVRQTLRVAWMDPGLDTVASSPVFFTAAWSAIRPNVGKSFLSLAKSLRSEATEAVATAWQVPDLRKVLEGELSEEEVRRLEESARAAHLVTAKVQIVLHALVRAARRERIPGTGREEAPVRRGVPDWQRWMTFRPIPEGAREVLDEAVHRLGLPVIPPSLRLFSKWPPALRSLWEDLGRFSEASAWPAAVARLRRMVLGGIGTLPHPVELQWTALLERGFGEQERTDLCSALEPHEAAMPAQTLIAAFAWTAFGSPEIGTEG
jgi:hypothetical protein